MTYYNFVEVKTETLNNEVNEKSTEETLRILEKNNFQVL